MSGFEVLPFTVRKEHSDTLKKAYSWMAGRGSTRFTGFQDFVRFKRKEAALEAKSEYLIHDGSAPIGCIEIKKLYDKPVPIFTLFLLIDEVHLNGPLKEKLRTWLLRQYKNRRVERILAYESRQHVERFYLEIGGRIANWLRYYELPLVDINMDLLKSWDQPSVLDCAGVRLEYFHQIPDHLLEEHARLHTELSNDILRKDHSWEVLKTAGYTKKRQELLALQGKRAEIGYLFDGEGHIVGMTKMVFDAATADSVYQTITGVSKSYRGKGLAKLLKANMMRRIMKTYPEVAVVQTDCLLGNAPMIFINEKMGFRRKLVPDEKEIILEKLFLHQNQKRI